MTASSKQLSILGVEAKVIGRPEVTSAATIAGVPRSEMAARTRIARDLYVIEWPAVVEVVPGRGNSIVTPLRLILSLEAADAEHLVAAMTAAGWRA